MEKPSQMKRKILFPIQALLSLIILVMPLQKSTAIPAFARKYQISCQVCHSPVARLKPFGETFAGDGYRLTQYESPRYFIQTGDDKLSLLRELPIAVRIDGMVSTDFGRSGKVDFGTPLILKFMSGGELSDKLSYYFYFLASEAGEMVGIEDAFLMYHDLLGTGVNFTIGQFQVCDPMYKRELRLTLEDTKILTAAPGNSGELLTYDRGIMFDYEIPSIKTQFLAEILNGNGIGLAGDGFLFDNDKFKNVMGRISQPIGKYLDIGLFGYSGRQLIRELPSPVNSNIKMFGPSLKLDFNEKLMINIQYVKRIDSEVYIESDDIIEHDITTQGGFAEITYTPKGDMSKWYLTGLLNWVDSDLKELNYKSATIHAGYILRRNVRLFSEFTWLSDADEYAKLSLGFMSAF
jgi:hypothetical protein